MKTWLGENNSRCAQGDEKTPAVSSCHLDLFRHGTLLSSDCLTASSHSLFIPGQLMKKYALISSDPQCLKFPLNLIYFFFNFFCIENMTISYLKLVLGIVGED